MSAINGITTTKLKQKLIGSERIMNVKDFSFQKVIYTVKSGISSLLRIYLLFIHLFYFAVFVTILMTNV